MSSLKLVFTLTVVLALQSCGDSGGSSDNGNANPPQREESPTPNPNPETSTNCSVSITHPMADGSSIECFSLSVAETNRIIKSSLKKKGYSFPANNATRTLSSSPTCITYEEGPGEIDAMFSLVLDGTSYDGAARASNWTTGDRNALKDSLSKIPGCE